MANSYMVVETTFLEGCRNFSLQSNADVENGAIVGKGDLVTGEDTIYVALDDYTNGMYLVAHPAWSYDTCRKVNQNEENFINKAGIPFRVYELKKDAVFTVWNLPDTITLEEGDFVEFKNGAYAKATANTALKVDKVKTIGFPYYVGSAGTQLAGDTNNEYGYNLNLRNTRYTIRVVS